MWQRFKDWLDEWWEESWKGMEEAALFTLDWLDGDY